MNLQWKDSEQSLISVSTMTIRLEWKMSLRSVATVS